MNKKHMLAILETKALVDLPELIETLGRDEAQELASCAEDYALWLLRVARYIEGRTYDMQDHKYAMYEQNRVLAKVRKALGYTYPKQDITW